MPLIDTKLNIPLPAEKEKILKAKLGEAISTFPGKSESWLMLQFTDQCRLWFRGESDSPLAMVEVKLFGTASGDACAEMTKRICDIFHAVLGIQPDHVYVNYTFSTVWGWNGINF